MAPMDTRLVDEQLRSLNGWERHNREIRKEFKFAGFKQAIAFVNKVADAAEAADHHPDIDIRYNRVTMTLSTHSEGGITEKDFALATQIERAA